MRHRLIQQPSKLFSNGLKLSLALSVAWGIFQPALSNAESNAGILITREGSNINITFDPAILSTISSHQQEGRTTIRIPANASAQASTFLIDPELRKSGAVKETTTAQGKVITVHSSHVYLVSQELRGLHNPFPKSETTPAKQSTSTPVKQAAPHPTLLKSEPAKALSEVAALLLPQGSPSKISKPTPSAKASNPPTQGVSKKAQSPGKPSEALLSVGRSHKAKSALQEQSLALPDTSRTEQLELDARQPKTNKALSTLSLPKPNDNTQETLSAANGTSASDPEQEPLELYQTQHEAAVQNANGALVRMIVGLLTVLALFAGFAKLMLPKLMERYPTFFENLKRQQHPDAPRVPQSSTQERPPVRRPQPKAMRGPEPEEDNATHWPTSAVTPTPLETPMPSNHSHSHPQEPGKRKFLERLSLGGKQFQVMSTTDLGKGKELHLVEIMGHQLVIATTPYTVTLVKDLTASENTTTDSSATQDSISSALSGLLSLNNNGVGNHNGMGGQANNPVISNETSTQEGTDDDFLEVWDVPESKNPYASKPAPKPLPIQPNQPAQRPTTPSTHASLDLPQRPAQPQPQTAEQHATSLPVHLKYLQPQEMNEQQRALKNQAMAQRKHERSTTSSQHDAFESDIIDATEVVILEDYDDFYGV